MNNIITSIKKDLAEYVGVYPRQSHELGFVLNDMVSRHSSSIYLDEEKLRNTLKDMNVDDASALKVCLMTKVTGFETLLQNDVRTKQSDLDRYVKNAVEKTGLNRAEVMGLTADIALSVGAAFNYSSSKMPEGTALNESAFVIPSSLYKEELRKFQLAFKKSDSLENFFSTLNFDALEPLVAAGLPEAKFLLGYCLLNGTKMNEKSAYGIRLLQEAANAGDIQASAVLGDYYFNKGVDDWGKAYDFYTDFGALALNRKRQEAITTIFNQKLFNRKFLGLNILLFIILVVCFICAPASAIYATHRILGSICAIADLAILILAIVHYRVKPYDNLYYVTAGTFVSWSLYLAVRLLF